MQSQSVPLALGLFCIQFSGGLKCNLYCGEDFGDNCGQIRHNHCVERLFPRTPFTLQQPSEHHIYRGHCTTPAYKRLSDKHSNQHPGFYKPLFLRVLYSYHIAISKAKGLNKVRPYFDCIMYYQ